MSTEQPKEISGFGQVSCPKDTIAGRRRRRRSTLAQPELKHYEHRFHYKPLDRTRGAIRLIKIFPFSDDARLSCRIERHHASTAKYIALSYVWGNEEATHTILLNGQVFRVRPNLYSFLRHVAKNRAMVEDLYWIDAISINQGDVNERNGHVRHMNLIYQSAQKVIAWLGSTGISREATPCDWTCCKGRETDLHEHGQHDCAWKIPGSTSWDFVTHSYWSRLWIAQELGLAQRVDVLWKGRFYDWRRLRSHLSRAIHQCRSHRPATQDEQSAFQQTMTHIQTRPIARYFKETRSEVLGNLVPRFQRHECQIGHDHVFALLSMASDGDRFEPNYAEDAFSLLLRLLTFSFSSPSCAMISGIGKAMGLNLGDGIWVDVCGHLDRDSTEAEKNSIYYQLIDTPADEVHESDILVRLPDTNLHILYRMELNRESTEVERYRFFSRVSKLSAKVEQAKKKFGAASEVVLSSQTTNGVAKHLCRSTITRKVDLPEAALLHCNWPAVLEIFDTSKTEAQRGRLESQIRKWCSLKTAEAVKSNTYTLQLQGEHRI